MRFVERFVDRVFATRGVEILRTPRQTYDYWVEAIPQSREVLFAVGEDELYLMGLHEMVVPDTRDGWKNLVEMMANESLREGKGIRIIAPPNGSPPDVASGWVGVTVPFSKDTPVPPLVFVTEGLRRLGMDNSEGRCFAVSGPIAVSALEAQNLTATGILREYMPSCEDPEQVLFFNADVCRVVDVTL